MIGIIGAMQTEVELLISKIEEAEKRTVSGIDFFSGRIENREVVVAKCGIGKVFAAICAQTMILEYGVSLIINTGVGGAISDELEIGDIAVSSAVVQHDMDTSAIGDEKGLVSGINKIYFESDASAVDAVILSGYELGITVKKGTIATGDKFIADSADRERIISQFGASACEMEGGAIAHTAFVNGIPFVVVRAISDGANSDSAMDFPTFLAVAAKKSEALTLALVEKYQK